MSKSKSLKTVYICQQCEFESFKWVGQCPNCEEWNTLVETFKSSSKSGGLGSRGSKYSTDVVAQPTYLSEIVSKDPKRISSKISEFDRVLGGGFVPGQVILLTGEPGIGKSTILTQISKDMEKSKEIGSILYVCGEESPQQIRLRASRIGYKAEKLLMLQETDADIICNTLETTKDVSLVIVDSVQTIFSTEFMGAPGSVGQVRGSTHKLVNQCKRLSIPMILVGHVTKEGAVAGPKVLEHLVDTVLYLEGDSQHLYRVLKTTKNRFGPVSEVGIFEMSSDGMREVKNPSEMFLSERLEGATGSCVTVLMEGYRPILFEIQALTSKTPFGYPRRTTSGYNVNRLQLMIAILEKRCGLNLSNHDVYINVAGGFKVDENACDLAVCLAIASSLKNKSINNKVAVFGECGLSGEVRKVPHGKRREEEAKKLGYGDIISPSRVKSVKKAVDLIL